jgi:3-oxoacyl-[acyl-carrier protein] reductase
LPDLDGKIAVVTGAGSGIGRGLAVAMARVGAKVVLCGRRLQPLANTVQAIERAAGRSGTAVAIQADISDEFAVQRVMKTALDRFGTVDILVNNAGIGGGGTVHDHSIEQWDQIMAVNLRGPFLMARAVLPIFREKRSGHIINISSESGLEYYQGDGAYGVSKHALNALSEYIQRENQDFNIRVDTICPGMVVTEMSENSPGLNHEKCLYPEDIADLVIWLLTRRPNIKIGRPILIQTMLNPWE